MTKNEITSLIPEFLINSETYSLVIINLEGFYVYVNPLFEKQFSFVCDNFIGQSSLIAIYFEDHDKCLKAIQQCFAQPNKPIKVYLRKPASNDQDFYWTEWEFSILKDQNQQPIGIICLGHDITETERANQKAKEFAAKVEKIIEEITDGFYVLNRKWEFVKINKVAEQILEIPREKLLGCKIWDLFPDTPDYNYPAAYRRAMDEYLIVTFEDYLADVDKWFSTVCYPSPEGLTIFFKDITQEKKTQEALKFSEIKLRAILDSTNDSNILISPDYKILSFNRRASEISQLALGKPLKELADMWAYVLPHDAEDFYRDTQKALNGEYLKFEREIHFEHFSLWFEIGYFSVHDSEGKMLGFTFNSTNIDQRKKKEIKLEESKIRMNKTLEAIPHPFIIVNEQMSITHVNSEFEKVFGYTEQEVINKKMDFLIPERYQNEYTQHQNQYLQTNGKLLRKFSENILALTKSKQEINITANLNTFTVGGEKFAIVILQDITEFKKREETILKQNETLKQIAWQQSHEVRRPVASILGLINIIKTDKTFTQEEKEQCLTYLFQATQELDTIIHKIVAQTNANEHIVNR